MRFVIAAATFACCSCAPAAPDEPRPREADIPATVASEAPNAPRAAKAPDALAGQYRVAGVNGESVDMGWAMTLAIDEDRLELQSQCVTPVWSYTYQQGGLTTEALPVPICDRGRYPEEEAAVVALDGASSVTRTPQNGLLIAGEGGTLTIFSQ